MRFLSEKILNSAKSAELRLSEVSSPRAGIFEFFAKKESQVIDFLEDLGFSAIIRKNFAENLEDQKQWVKNREKCNSIFRELMEEDFFFRVIFLEKNVFGVPEARVFLCNREKLFSEFWYSAFLNRNMAESNFELEELEELEEVIS